MDWITLETEIQLEDLIAKSYEVPQVIFKHSTRCSISIMAKNRLERSGAPEGIPFYYLDLLTYRPLSNLIADRLSVYHQSPQLILVKNGNCVYEETHSAIDMGELTEQLS
jgi:bacillithiol system protein YtxJ